MANMIVFSLILAQFLVVNQAFRTVQRPFTHIDRCNRLASNSGEDLSELSVVELKSKLRSAGLFVSGTKKELIERLSTKAAPSTPVLKTSTKLGGLLRRRSVIKAVKSGEDEDIGIIEEKSEVTNLPPVPSKKIPVEVKKVVKAWDSRKELVEKTTAVEVRKIVMPPATVPQQSEKVMEKAASGAKKAVKSVKEVVAAYDIDDDDFMSQFMDSPSEKKSIEQQSARQTRASTSSSRAVSDSGPVSESNDDNRAVWPGPGVSWMPGPSGDSSKKDSNRGRNTLMAAADDDLQRMVDERNDARYRRDYDGADAIREELRTVYRVEIYDKLGEWVAADGRWGLSNRKRGAGATEDGVPVLAKIQADAKPCELTYDQIMDMVIKRTNARRTRQFQAADDIRDQLARQGVELFDKVNEWRTYDGLLRGIQSEDFEKYEVKKDTERYDRSRSRDKTW